MNINPTTPNERLESLDIVRGFALFGIFLVNMPAFQWPDLLAQLYLLPESLSALDEKIRLFFDLLIQGKFYTIFAFLFGVGFYLFMNKASNQGDGGRRLYLRRIGVLALFGFIHLVFFWYGDILLTYALAGLFLLFFYHRSVTTLLVWACLLMLLFAILIALNILLISSFSEAQLGEVMALGEAAIDEAITIYQQASINEWLAYRWQAEVIPILENIPFSALSVLFMFLVGLVAAKKGFIQHPESHRSLLYKVIGIGLVLSLPISVAIILLHLGILHFGLLTSYIRHVLVSISGVFLSLVYIAFLLLLFQKEKWLYRLRPLGYAGRMALSNYIGQTLVGVGIYTGLGWFGQINLLQGVLIAVPVYILQIIFSYYWLKRYRFGPLEWVWRSLTYGKIQPMKNHLP